MFKLKEWVINLFFFYNCFMATNIYAGLVIKTIDYDDYDQIITILTHDDLLTFISKGTRKIKSKNRVALQLGNIIEAEIFQARLRGKVSKLKKATIIKQPPLEKSDTAKVWLLLIKYLKNLKEPNQELFQAIVETYDYFGDKYNHYAKTYILFKYLNALGIKPNIEHCVECNRKDMINGFEFYKGGFTCSLHTDNERELDFLKGIASMNDFKKYIEINPKHNTQIFEEIEKNIKTNSY